MKGIYNDLDIDYEEWSKLERNFEIIDVELRFQKRRLFREKYVIIFQFDWFELFFISKNIIYYLRIFNVLLLGISFEYYLEFSVLYQ